MRLDSSLPMERYHALADGTMDSMLESLEVLLDNLGYSQYEVEYSVRGVDSSVRGTVL